MTQIQNTIHGLVDSVGISFMHDGRYVIVKSLGVGEDQEWYLIVAECLDAAIDYEGPGDDCSVWSATPYLTRNEALGEAYDLRQIESE